MSARASPETREQIKALWLGGQHSYLQVAAACGVTEGVVAGVVFRTGLQRTTRLRAYASCTKPTKRTPQAAAANVPGVALEAPSPARVVQRIAPASAVMPPVAAKQPFVATARKCQFPLWPHLAKATGKFCDAPSRAGKSWCDRHCEVVFARAQPGVAA